MALRFDALFDIVYEGQESSAEEALKEQYPDFEGQPRPWYNHIELVQCGSTGFADTNA